MKTLSIILAFMLTISMNSQAENKQRAIDSIQSLLKTPKQDTCRVNLLNELSADYIDFDLYDSAIYIASISKDLAQRLRFDVGVSAALRRIGVAFSEQGEYPKALDYFFQSLKIAELIKNDHEIAMDYNAIGVSFCGQRDYEHALNYFFKALAIKKNNDALTYSNIGRAYRFQFKYNLSMTFYQKAIDAWGSDKNEISSILNNIGDNYEQENDYGNAMKFYLKSLNIKNELNDEQGISDACGSIGDLLLKQRKYREAIPYEIKSLFVSQKINYKYGIKESSKSLSDIYEHLNDNKKSMYFYKYYIAVRDSMYNEENTKKIIRNEMNFQFDKKEAIQKIEMEKKDALSNSEIEKKQNERNGVIAGMGIVIIFSIFLFRSYNQTKKAKNIISEQKKVVDYKNKQITDNITYAQRIQKAILPSDEYIKNNLPENFLIYKPKDIVSGDFYWTYRDGDVVYFATADSTGHGVSGSMISMIGASLLNEIVINRKITSPEKVLNTLREEIIKSINQEGADEERKDGMDIVFCKIDGMKLTCACANNNVYIIRNKTIICVSADRFPVGKYMVDAPSFTLNTIDLQSGDTIYTMSDGFCDQFGGPKEKKLMSKRLKEWMIEFAPYTMQETKIALEDRFAEWIGNGEQTDDITIFSVRI